ncbi:MAG TPA: DUF2089 family protein [Planctomycetota bacterium]|nr:DUF2089 family protein [Planctomycetota bacterium]
MAKWIEELSDEDLSFLKRFILASGSLKELATAYGISYPTVRLRLDRLIDKIRSLESAQRQSELERTLRQHYADGKLDAATFKALLMAHKKDMEAGHAQALSDTSSTGGDLSQPGGRADAAGNQLAES